MQTDSVVQLLSGHGAKPDMRGADKQMTADSGFEKLELNGCVHCNKYIFEPRDKETICPRCGGSRYKSGTRTPSEIVLYFPLRKRLEALLRLPNFMSLLQVCKHGGFILMIKSQPTHPSNLSN